MDTETMRYYYQNGLWPIDRLDKLLAAGRITEEQYLAITAPEPNEASVEKTEPDETNSEESEN